MLVRFVGVQMKQNSYFLCGLWLGLWAALALLPLDEEAAAPCAEGGAPPAAADDEYAPAAAVREAVAAGASAGGVVRPRYYRTELGMRLPLLAALLTEEAQLAARAATVNASSRLPAARLFVLARGPRLDARAAPGVVGFTDTREMLKPFHVLKYLADNYLDEYNFFFLASDTAYVNGLRLMELVGHLSVSQDVYMGVVDGEDSHYCLLESGILLSNSVLRKVQSKLDWCVRNSYSAHHHENLGRCIAHAAHLSCTDLHQGQRYEHARVSQPLALSRDLRRAVTAGPLLNETDLYLLHAYVSRVYLEEDRREMAREARRAAGLRSRRAALLGAAPDALWPPGLRHYPSDVPLNSRFDHTRWRWFNTTHSLLEDERRAASALPQRDRAAALLVVEEVRAWAGAREAALLEGAVLWAPHAALHYRLLLRLTYADQTQEVRMFEATRPLGATRLVPAPYVTESAALTVLLLLPPANPAARAALALARHAPHNNTALLLVAPPGATDAEWAALERLASAGTGGVRVNASRAPLRRVLGALRSQLVLLVDPDVDYNEDFLNRVRMNSLPGVQWFLPAAPARGVAGDAARFTPGAPPRALAAAAGDILQALEKYPAAEGADIAAIARAMAAGPLACLHAPDPGASYSPPRAAPCRRRPATTELLVLKQINELPDTNSNLHKPSSEGSNVLAQDEQSAGEVDWQCLSELRANHFRSLELGSRQSLVTLLLEQRDLTELQT